MTRRRPTRLAARWFGAAIFVTFLDMIHQPTAAAETVSVAAAVGCGTALITKIPVTIQHGLPVVSLSANGQPITLVLDTGAERTILTPAAGERIKAQPPQVEFTRQARGIAGSLPTREIELRSFAAGNAEIPWHRALVASIATPTVSPSLDGLLGVESLSDFDIDLDLPNHQLGLYRKQSCPTAAPDWPYPFSRINTGRSRGDHLFFPVQLDDHQVIAFIDTGSQGTILSMAAARAVGLSDASFARDRRTSLQSVTAARLDGYLHRFSKLAIAELIIRDPLISVADLKLGDADIVLGIDFVGGRRLWLSYGSRQIFLPTRETGRGL